MARASHNWLLTVLVAALTVATALPASARAQMQKAQPADWFVNSVGVNVHLHYDGSVYDRGFETIVKPKLVAAGIRHVRDGAYTGTGEGSGSKYYRRCRELAAAGIRFDLVTAIRTKWSGPTDYAKLPAVAGWCGGAVDGFENSNEPDVQPMPAGYDWRTQTILAQRSIYTVVNGTASTRPIPVIGPAIAFSPLAVGDLSAYLDYGNWHPYPGGQCPICGDVYHQTFETLMPRFRKPSGSKQLMATETGYNNAIHSGANGNRPVSELAAGKYMPRLLLELYKHGFARTYLYELIDERPDPARTRRDSNFGLLRNDGSEKPAYRAVKSLLRLLSDRGPAFKPGSLDYTLTGNTSGLDHLLLQNRDGTFMLAVWLEKSSYDTGARPNAPDALAARRDLAVPDQRVTLKVGSTTRPARLDRFQSDGTVSSSAATLSGGALTLNVSDRLTLIELH
jgi:hypothetical protein